MAENSIVASDANHYLAMDQSRKTLFAEALTEIMNGGLSRVTPVEKRGVSASKNAAQAFSGALPDLKLTDEDN